MGLRGRDQDLFAVLTCIPAQPDQRAVIAETARILAAGGLLYLSDLSLQDDPRNRARHPDHGKPS